MTHVFRAAYAVTLMGALLWCGAIVAAPAAAAATGPLHEAAGLLYGLFRPVCHQLDSRSFHLFGAALGVCSRCASVYAAFLCGVVLYPFVKQLDHPVPASRLFLVLPLLPMLLDVAADAVGVHASTVVTRSLTGVIAGAPLAFFVVPAAQEAACQILRCIPLPQAYMKKGKSNA